MAAIEADYLVVGAGGCAMAFVDTLLGEAPGATIVMVDRHHRPGGHWNEAYPFVRLHQPSAWYGVPSRELTDFSREQGGFNDGLLNLATGAEVMAHFEAVMKQRFLPSGRVRWLPKCEWLGGEAGEHRVRSLLTGEEHTIEVRRKLVNATHARTEVPATHPPKYAVHPGVQCIPPNALPRVDRPYARYTVVGAGKTGMDACLWLVENGVPHDRIRWVMPRDPWVIDRATMQPGPDGWRLHFQTTLAQLDAICQAADVPDLYRRLEECGAWMRFDEGVEPTAYRCAIVSQAESEQLRLIADKVRLGRVRSIEPTRMVLERGEVPADADTLYVDCSSSAIQPTPKVQVFDGGTVNILMVRFCQPLFSASLVGWVEAHVADPQEQNALCRPVRGPELPIDFLRMWLPTMANAAKWREHADLTDWLAHCRLNGQAVVLRGVDITPEVKELLRAIGQKAAQAAPKIPQLLGMAK